MSDAVHRSGVVSLIGSLQVSIVVYAVLQLLLLVFWSRKPNITAMRTGVAAASLSFIASLMLLPMSYLEHGKTFRPSLILNFYLFITMILDAAILRTLWLSSFDLPIRVAFTASFGAKVILVALEAIEKRRHFRDEYSNTSPEESSGLYGQGLLWWLNDIILLGARQLLRPIDLYPINKDMSSQVLDTKFWKVWNECGFRTSCRSLILKLR
jgi:ATP-binding cassette, subfamily C (CFTR/MRP), member 1